MTWVSALVALSFVGLSAQQAPKDPLKDFCRRWGHQTAVIDDKLLIDGGYINYSPLDQNPQNNTNTNLLYSHLSEDNGGMPQQYANLTKPAQVPSVAGGILWPDTVNKRAFLFGGEYATQSSVQSFAMWDYDVLYDKWESLTPDSTSYNIERPAWGAGTVAQDLGLGFYYGGWISNTTVPVWGSAPPVALSNMIIYDMVKNNWRNVTGPDGIGRAEGSMNWIPAGDGGLLVYFGGIQGGSNGNYTSQPLDTIFIYDIANSKWYTEKATGTVPEDRRRFCGGATWSKDRSSFDIYIYGGASFPPLTVGYDDLYALSLPSMQWVKMYPDSPGQAFPHHSLSCNVINSANMIVMGGTFPNSTDCDVPDVYGQHNSDLGKQNADNAIWGDFVYNKTVYEVPPEIIAVIGGSADGGATAKSPKIGFKNPDMSSAFAHHYTTNMGRTATRPIPTASSSPTPTPTPKPTKKKVNGGVIGGAVVAGLAGLALIGGLIFFLLRRRRNNAAAATTPRADTATLAGTISPAPELKYPHESYYPVYAHSPPPQQLPSNEEDYVAELQGAEVGRQRTMRYSTTTVGSVPVSYASSPPLSPTPMGAHSAFSPMNESPQSKDHALPVQQAYQQTYYPPPGSPQQSSSHTATPRPMSN